MKYLVIKNDGVIEIGAFTLLGASTKRDNPKLIGKFGSGATLALAVLCRIDAVPQIIAGHEHIDVSLEPVTFRGETFDRLHLNGEPTSITSTAAFKWQAWQAIRELVANAKDEGGYEHFVVDEAVLTESIERGDNTHIIVPVTDEIDKVLAYWDDYFLLDDFEKDVLFTDGDCSVLPKPATVRCTPIYREGLRCLPMTYDSPAHFAYNIEPTAHRAEVNEERFLEGWLAAELLCLDMLLKCDNDEVVSKIVRHLDDGHCWETLALRRALEYSYLNRSPSGTWKHWLQQYEWFPTWMRDQGDDLASATDKPRKYVQERIYRWLVDFDFTATFGSYSSEGLFRVVEATPHHKRAIEAAMSYITRLGITTHILIDVVEFQGSGDCALKGNRLLISRAALEHQDAKTVAGLIIRYIPNLEHEIGTSAVLEQRLAQMMVNISVKLDERDWSLDPHTTEIELSAGQFNENVRRQLTED